MNMKQSFLGDVQRRLQHRLIPAKTSGVIEHLQGLMYLVETILDGLMGGLKPAAYIASIDPGLGKTLAAITVLREWKQRGFLPNSSVLIIVSTKAEIRAYASGIGLDPHEFAVVTTDSDLNQLGSSEDQHGNAPIMFTTHKMLQSRSKGRSFAGLEEFHYQGARRMLLLWDESIEFGQWSVFEVSKLAMVRAALTRGNAELDGRIFELEQQLRSVERTSNFAMPDLPEAPADLRISGAASKALAQLISMAQTEVLLAVSEDGHRSLIRPLSSLPSDLTPMIVLDASARVRPRYGMAMKHRGGLLTLPSVVRDYSKLRIHVWERGCGKQALAKAGTCTDIAREIAHKINENRGGEWLVLHYMECPHIVDDIRGYIAQDVTATIHSTHWGRHTATNEFSEVQNVVLIGQPTYAEEAYLTQCYAAAGQHLLETQLPTLKQIKRGEYQHHYLQAACRGSIRSGKQSTLHVVVTPTDDVAGWLATTFPNATITRWKLSRVPLTGRKEEAIEYLRRQFADPLTAKVSKKDVRMAVNMTAANFRNQVQKQQDFKEVLESEGLVMAYNHFERQPSGFEPCEGALDEEPI